MSVRFPGVVENSCNLGMIDIAADNGACNFLVRSLIDSAGHELAGDIEALFSLAGASVEQSGHYPGWAPNADSPLLARCQRAYRETFHAPAETCVIHAGLECGLIGGKYPALDMVSFGPTIRGAHAPGEAVEIASVDRCWTLLKALLTALAS
jgi:dipeptidase D